MIKDLLAVVDNADKAAPFLRHLVNLAERTGAPAEVMLLTPGPMASPGLAPFGALYVPDEVLAQDERTRLDAVAAAVAGAKAPVAVHGVRDDVAWLAGDLRRSRQIADLILIGGRDAWELQWLRRRMAETLLLSSGTPILVLPSSRGLEPIRRAVLGWKPSPEATRAVHDLVRLAEPGAEIRIVTIGDRPDPRDVSSGDEVVRHLSRHGFAASLHHEACEGRLEADLLQQFALTHHADLLAVGGFAHSRIREVMLGGVTRDLIDGVHLPVLLSH